MPSHLLSENIDRPHSVTSQSVFTLNPAEQAALPAGHSTISHVHALWQQSGHQGEPIENFWQTLEDLCNSTETLHIPLDETHRIDICHIFLGQHNVELWTQNALMVRTAGFGFPPPATNQEGRARLLQEMCGISQRDPSISAYNKWKQTNPPDSSASAFLTEILAHCQPPLSCKWVDGQHRGLQCEVQPRGHDHPIQVLHQIFPDRAEGVMIMPEAGQLPGKWFIFTGSGFAGQQNTSSPEIVGDNYFSLCAIQ